MKDIILHNDKENTPPVVITNEQLVKAMAKTLEDNLIKPTLRDKISGHSGVNITQDIEEILKYVQQENYDHIQKHTQIAKWAFKLNSFITLQRLKIFPNLKEVTESFAALKAMMKSLTKIYHIQMKDINAQVIVVGDGTTPRTATTIALNSPFICHSIDPMMKNYILPEEIVRVKVYGEKVENIHITGEPGQLGIIVSVHSHAPLNFIGKSIKFDKYLLISIPCCIPLNPLDSEELSKRVLRTYSYMEHGIWSPKNIVNICYTND